ncbi:MAG TPA: TSUP family transporter, partial [Thermodesulfobacteriota bacterium]|nr:TSUP family transporter [Thermodesulfobacteriota bacterium]
VNIVAGNKYERFLNVPVGLVNGFLNGLTGTQVIPMLPYLISLELHRDLLIGAINIGFTASTLVLIALLGKFDFLSLHIIGISVAGIIPVSLGIYLGGKLRYRISESRFRIAVLVILLIIGINLILNR